MRTLGTLFSTTLLSATLMAQGVITRQNAGVSTFYYDGDIQAVLEDAAEFEGMDTILLGGGTYFLTADIVVNSPVVMIGTGTHPDSSLAHINNGRTEFDGGNQIEMFIDANATGSEFHGLALVNFVDIGLGLPNQFATSNADSISFFRCEIPGLYLGYGNQGSLANDTYIEECLIGYLDISESSNTTVRNCALNGGMVNALPGNNCLVENCIFFNWNLNANAGVQYENNVFVLNQGTVLTVNQQSTFNNNLFVGSGSGFDVTFNTGGGVVANGNEVDYPLSGANGAFPSLTVTSYTAFDYYADYHVASVWSGLDAGIFGGGNPWKEGSVPFNPHWIELTTPNGTDNGTLQGVTIKASAQQD